MTPKSNVSTTCVYDRYWQFAAERQAIFFRRLCGEQSPWTDDPVLTKYRFTNAYRASDRVSQFLIRNVIYGRAERTVQETFFRIVLFKLFNKVETWQLLKRSMGEISWQSFSLTRYARVLEEAKQNGQSIYSSAYIMPSGTRATGYGPKHENHLRLLQMMMKKDAPKRVAEASTMQAAYEQLRSFPMVGPFLAYQFVTDLNYSELTNFSEMEFVVPGPGAKSGIRKCFRDTGGLSEAGVIRYIADRQDEEFEKRGLTFQSLWGRRLQLIDCQNLFCEVDKYARVAYPEVAGLGGRMKIKRKYTPSRVPPSQWYPPKWGINDMIAPSQSESTTEESHAFG